MIQDIWLALRRPLLLLFVLGCVVSIEASGRFTARLIVDGAISFAFVPIFEMLSLGAVYTRRHRAISFARAVDLFFVSNMPWLVWLLAFAGLRAIATPIQATLGLRQLVMSLIELSLLVPIVWAARMDRRYFADVLPGPSSPMRRLLAQRSIAWLCGFVYFLGYAAWPEIIGRIAS